MCNTRKDPESERVTWDNLETNPITVKPETASHAAEQLSWVPLPSCSPLECPFPVNFSLLCQHTCLLEQFLSVRQEPPLRPWKGPVFLQQQSYHAMQPQAQRADTQACCALIHRCHRAHDKTRLNRLAPRQLAKSGWKVIALSLIYPCFISTWYLAKMLPAASWEISSSQQTRTNSDLITKTRLHRWKLEGPDCYHSFISTPRFPPKRGICTWLGTICA